MRNGLIKMLNNSRQAALPSPHAFCSAAVLMLAEFTGQAPSRPVQGRPGGHSATRPPDSTAPQGARWRGLACVIAHLSEAPRPLPACVSQADIAQGGRGRRLQGLKVSAEREPSQVGPGPGRSVPSDGAAQLQGHIFQEPQISNLYTSAGTRGGPSATSGRPGRQTS